ncbi:MAG: universal stress protein [bacterium]|nr:universal stress protein [bacterium]
MLRTILVALDGSRQSLAALELAISVAGDMHSRLVLVSAIDAGEAERILADAGALVAASEITYASHVLDGPPVSAILDAARAHDVDLIVMGTQGRSGAARAVLGSTSEGVLREGRVPILVTRGLSRNEPHEPQGTPRRSVEAARRGL